MVHTLDHVLGTTAKVRLLRALFPLDSPTTGREAERLARVSHRSALRALEDLVALGVLARTTTRATHLYRVNREHALAPLLEALFQGEVARLASLGEDIEAAAASAGLAEALVSVAVFGSAARGEARPGSDLDVLVIVHDPSCAEAARESLSAVSDRLLVRYGARVSVLALSMADARRRFEDGDPLLKDVLRDGRTLSGLPVQEALGAW